MTEISLQSRVGEVVSCVDLTRNDPFSCCKMQSFTDFPFISGGVHLLWEPISSLPHWHYVLCVIFVEVPCRHGM
jgi:hypothetical protein